MTEQIDRSPVVETQYGRVQGLAAQGVLSFRGIPYGDPSHAELPDWPAYDPARRATMLFDLPESRPADDPDGEARRFLLDWPHASFL